MKNILLSFSNKSVYKLRGEEPESPEMWSSAKASPAPQTKSLGMTAPISNAGPEEKDLELTSELQETLIPHGCFESEEELNHRMDVLR